MSKKKKKPNKQIQLIHLHLDAIQTDINVLFDVVGKILAKPDCGGECGCKDPVDTGETVTTTTAGHNSVTWITPETKVAALEEANASLWEQLEDVEQEADDYARQNGDLRASIAGKEALIEKYRRALSRISNYQEDNPAEVAWEALESRRG